MAITTAAEYKTHAGIGGTTDDTYIGTLVTEAQELAEDYVGYTLDGASRTEYHSGAGSNVIILKATPVVSITSVKPYYADSTAGTAWDSTAYKFDPDSGELRLTPEFYTRYTTAWDADEYGGDPLGEFSVQPAFGDQFRNIQVIYLAGWGSSPYTAAPTRLKASLWRIIDAIYRSRALATGTAEGDAVDVSAVVAKEMKPYSRMLP